MKRAIGIPLCLDDRGRWRPAREYLYVDAAYPRAIERAGGVPVLLPVQGDPERALERVDGLLLPGGDDLLPPRPYPDSVHFEPVPERQLDFDRGLLRAALDAELPVLGICYGAQLLALARGGTLHYDIPTDLPRADEHAFEASAARHAVAVAPGTRLAAILGETAQVNSRHHQAVAEPGTGLRVSARAADGVIEAVETAGEPFCIGVQWHPETLDDPGSLALFAAFVAAGGERS